ncbi:TPA: UvrD-helicase domain-containing protein [Stenotrophomonas maltophilia]|uniref:UvrD-helicase domain-containing protein n=1 Tax=Stenotrophomonas maltophilia TaxID=40324 RepID=UPI00106F49B3|nr:UvrD-helicase domain-containing protein [Stenotrophomonas maltophilia]MBA0228789.1 ATP-dependent helicase [Stenotrophomonas maltophilia]UKJ25882.1 UvrD-helicase domain-containing protein [Stenotrophomonas maltophilia]
MLDPKSLLGVRRGSVVAPAGHGKTELIARLTGLGGRTLVLTHTHAGVHALRTRMVRLGIDPRAAAVDTLASWASRYTAAFPALGRPLGRMPVGGEWGQLYTGGLDVLSASPVRDVIAASYDRVLVDEYQDCDLAQHELVIALAEQLPTIVFGDHMQGIFGFGGNPSVSWEQDVFPNFPLLAKLEEPMRWQKSNPNLGEWIAHVRQQLEHGKPVDLTVGPAIYLPCDGEYDLSPLFHELEESRESIAAIHCRRGVCDQLAKLSKAAYQAIEDIACKTLQEFAAAWDQSSNAGREGLLKGLVDVATTSKKLKVGESDTTEDAEIRAMIASSYEQLRITGHPREALNVLSALRLDSRMRTFRAELIRDTTKALTALADGKHATLAHSAFAIRQRVSHMGRHLPKRTVSTPLLLKGLEFERVSIPDAVHFNKERDQAARAKLFYVAISRARSSLVIASSSPAVSFPIPG